LDILAADALALSLYAFLLSNMLRERIEIMLRV